MERRHFVFLFCCCCLSDIFDDSLPAPAQAYLKMCSAMSEAGLNDGKTAGTTAVLASQEQGCMSSSPGATVQRRSVVRTEEIVRPFVLKMYCNTTGQCL